MGGYCNARRWKTQREKSNWTQRQTDVAGLESPTFHSSSSAAVALTVEWYILMPAGGDFQSKRVLEAKTSYFLLSISHIYAIGHPLCHSKRDVKFWGAFLLHLWSVKIIIHFSFFLQFNQFISRNNLVYNEKNPRKLEFQFVHKLNFQPPASVWWEALPHQFSECDLKTRTSRWLSSSLSLCVSRSAGIFFKNCLRRQLV